MVSDWQFWKQKDKQKWPNKGRADNKDTCLLGKRKRIEATLPVDRRGASVSGTSSSAKHLIDAYPEKSIFNNLVLDIYNLIRWFPKQNPRVTFIMVNIGLLSHVFMFWIVSAVVVLLLLPCACYRSGRHTPCIITSQAICNKWSNLNAAVSRLILS